MKKRIFIASLLVSLLFSCDSQPEIIYSTKVCDRATLQSLKVSSLSSEITVSKSSGCVVLTSTNKEELAELLNANNENEYTFNIVSETITPESTSIEDAKPSITFPNIFDVFNRLLKQLNP